MVRWNLESSARRRKFPRGVKYMGAAKELSRGISNAPETPPPARCGFVSAGWELLRPETCREKHGDILCQSHVSDTINTAKAIAQFLVLPPSYMHPRY